MGLTVRVGGGAALAALLLGAGISLLGVAQTAARPLTQPSGPDVEDYFLDEFVTYPGALEYMSDVEEIDLTALTLGEYTQVCTATMAFYTGEVTESLANEIHSAPAWVAPVLSNGQAFSAILVLECPECGNGWDLSLWYPVELARGLEDFAPGDRLLTHWSEAFFRLRGDDLLPLDPDAWIMMPEAGTLSDYQRLLLDSYCPEGEVCGDEGGRPSTRTDAQAQKASAPLGASPVEAAVGPSDAGSPRFSRWLLALGVGSMSGAVFLALSRRLHRHSSE